ncbi:MAG: MmgE/PrpD family protein [Candidatus Dormibacteria bacterium]
MLLSQIADFVCSVGSLDLPTGAIDLVTDAITDAIGVGVAGSREGLAPRLRQVIGSQRAGGSVPLLGTDESSTEMEAALYNGTVIHALDFDDTAHPAYAHPSSHIVPVLISLGCNPGVKGEDLLTAYVIGLEVEGKLGRTLNMDHYLHGWHTTGTLGTLAAAVVAAKLLRLSENHTGMAIAIATSLASGIRSNFGTMTKPLHAGVAARNGILAARLAQMGFDASSEALDGHFGFFDVFGAGRRETSTWSELGKVWEISHPHGLALKAYPSCGATHPAIEAALLARGELGGREVAEVEVGTNRFSHEILIYADPREPLEGKFSMQFCIAAALVAGEVGLRTFTHEVLQSGDIQRLLPKIRVFVSDEMRDSTEFGATVLVRTTDGTCIQRAVPLAKGKPTRWLGSAELRAKFSDCVTPTWGANRADEAFGVLQTMRSWPDSGVLAKMLRGTV